MELSVAFILLLALCGLTMLDQYRRWRQFWLAAGGALVLVGLAAFTLALLRLVQ